MGILTSGELGGPKSCFPSPPEQTNICCYMVLKILQLSKFIIPLDQDSYRKVTFSEQSGGGKNKNLKTEFLYLHFEKKEEKIMF